MNKEMVIVRLFYNGSWDVIPTENDRATQYLMVSEFRKQPLRYICPKGSEVQYLKKLIKEALKITEEKLKSLQKQQEALNLLMEEMKLS